MLIENEFLTQIKQIITPDEDQLNGLLESDAELIRIDQDMILTITTDTIVEEINSELYTDPYQIGWMTAMVNLSDLAAVGADVKGFLVNLQTTRDTELSVIKSIMKGINDACVNFGIKVVGGDTNRGENIQLGGTAFGTITDNKIIMRKGNKPGDLLYMTGKMGSGSVFAFKKLIGKHQGDFSFLPQAKIQEGKIIRHWGSSCIDTSDAFFPAISNLMYINQHGIQLDGDLEDLIPDNYKKTMLNTSLPPWILLAGPHGEFELLFTVDAKNEKKLIESAGFMGWEPIKIGEIINEPILKFILNGIKIQCDPDDVSNLYDKSEGHLNNYLSSLLEMHQSWLKS